MTAQAPVSGTARRLVIAYAFPPYADTSAIVAAKRVRARGEHVDLIQNAMDEIRHRDSTAWSIAGHLVHRHSILETRSRFGSWRSIVDFCEEGMRTLTQWQADGTAYESMYSRAHFIASHFLAATYKMSSPATHWQAEFSDPLSRNALGELRRSTVRPGQLLDRMIAGITAAGGTPPQTDNVYVWGEYLTLALADELLFMNAAQRDYVLSLYSNEDPIIAGARDRAQIAPHPVPPPELYQHHSSTFPVDGDVVNIGYFGNFYKSQDPAALLAACADLVHAGRDGVRLHMFVGDVETMSAAIHRAGAEAVVRCHPRVPYLEFLALSQRMDILLAVDARTQAGQHRNPVLLSKWSDYRGSGTPVWGIVEEGSELDRQELTYRSPLGHRTAMLQVLTTLSRRSGARRAEPEPVR